MEPKSWLALFIFAATFLPTSFGAECNLNKFEEDAVDVVQCLCDKGVPEDRLVGPKNKNYQWLSRPRNKYYRKDPKVIVTPETTWDVQAAVMCAVANKLPVVPMSGGHQYEGKSATTGVLVNFAAKMNKILNFDNATGMVTFQPGIRLGNLYVSIHEISGGNYVYNGGSCTNVASGQLTTGGQGYFARVAGFSMDSLVSFEMVMADGSVKTVNESENGDLFWARYSCGPQFGIVTKWTAQTIKVPKLATLTQVDWRGADAMVAAIKSYQSWVGLETWPTECGPYLRLWPGKVSMVTICLLDKQETDTQFWIPFVMKKMPTESRDILLYKEVAPIRAFQDVIATSTEEWMTLDEIKRDTLEPIKQRSINRMKSRMVTEPLSDDAIKFAVDHFTKDGKVEYPDRAILKALGGAAKTGKPSSFPWRNALFKFPAHSSWTNPKDSKAGFKGMDYWDDMMEKYNVSKTVYCGYSDTTRPDWRERVWGPNLPRMTELKTTYDPKGVFNFGMDLVPDLDKDAKLESTGVAG